MLVHINYSWLLGIQRGPSNNNYFSTDFRLENSFYTNAFVKSISCRRGYELSLGVWSLRANQFCLNLFACAFSKLYFYKQSYFEQSKFINGPLLSLKSSAPLNTGVRNLQKLADAGFLLVPSYLHKHQFWVAPSLSLDF